MGRVRRRGDGWVRPGTGTRAGRAVRTRRGAGEYRQRGGVRTAGPGAGDDGLHVDLLSDGTDEDRKQATRGRRHGPGRRRRRGHREIDGAWHACAHVAMDDGSAARMHGRGRGLRCDQARPAWHGDDDGRWGGARTARDRCGMDYT